jgi:hypothetical protein
MEDQVGQRPAHLLSKLAEQAGRHSGRAVQPAQDAEWETEVGKNRAAGRPR